MKELKTTNKFKKFWSEHKKLIALSAVIVLPALAGVGAMSYASYAQAELNKAKVSDSLSNYEERTINNLTQAALIDSLAQDVKVELNSDNKISKEDLDVYAYYFIKYLESGVQYLSSDKASIDTADNLLGLLKQLYEKNGLTAPYERSEDGQTITLKETLSEPDDFKETWNKIKEDVVKPAVKADKNGAKDIDIDADVSHGEVVVHEKQN